jgi:hypothetical protein
LEQIEIAKEDIEVEDMKGFLERDCCVCPVYTGTAVYTEARALSLSLCLAAALAP